MGGYIDECIESAYFCFFLRVTWLCWALMGTTTKCISYVISIAWKQNFSFFPPPQFNFYLVAFTFLFCSFQAYSSTCSYFHTPYFMGKPPTNALKWHSYCYIQGTLTRLHFTSVLSINVLATLSFQKQFFWQLLWHHALLVHLLPFQLLMLPPLLPTIKCWHS